MNNDEWVNEYGVNKPKVIELSETILKTISVNDIIYAEFATEGTMGYAGQAILYIIKNEKLICFKTNIFTEENTYTQRVDEILCKHSGLSENIDEKADNSKNQFDYYSGGMGNHVFVNKDVFLKVVDRHFVYEKNNKEYHIYSSVFGVFDSVVNAMRNSENG